jgi:serine phosphatase RsbU (regulator of sigma subunit)
MKADETAMAPPSGTGGILRALIVEDSELDALLLVSTLEEGGFVLQSTRVDTAPAMAAALDGQAWDIIFSDHSMPHFSSTAALELLKARKLDIPFIIVSGTIGEEMAVAAMRAGASDYVLKGNLKRLPPVVSRELRDAVERRERRKAEKALLAHEEQLRIARDVQQQLFPATPPEIPGFDIAGGSFPAEETGGDYFDYLKLPDGSCGIIIADVTGHGLGPALLMVETRECLRALASTTGNIHDILTRADALLAEDFGHHRFVSLLFAQLVPGAASLFYLNAGHPAAYVLNAAGEVKHVLQNTGTVLGLGLGGDCPQAVRVPLAQGDMALLLTDGILEALSSNREEFGPDRTLDVVRQNLDKPAANILDALCRAVRTHTANQPQQDDITAIVIKVR